MSSPLVWVITGCSSGIGRELTIAALERGDKVIATTRARSFKEIEDLQTRGAHIMELDVTASLDELKTIGSQAVQVYGQVDVVVNNAGFYLIGSVEETSHEDTLNLFNTNLFGAMNVTRAFLPFMRERGTGTVAFIGSLAGWRGLPFVGVYGATKYAMRGAQGPVENPFHVLTYIGISNSLHLEISPFGLRSICFDPGVFRTPVFSKRPRWVPSIDAHKQAGKLVDASAEGKENEARGDPVVASRLIVDVIKGEGFALGKPFPTSLALGPDAYQSIKESCEETLACLEDWKDLSLSTDYALE